MENFTNVPVERRGDEDGVGGGCKEEKNLTTVDKAIHINATTRSARENSQSASSRERV